MNIIKLNEDLANGAVRRKIADLMRLNTSFALAVEVVARDYEATPQQMHSICKNDFEKHKKEVESVPMEKQKRQRTTEHRNQLIKFRFYDLHEKERLRLDDCILKVCEEFLVTQKTAVEVIRGAIASGEFELSGGDIIKRFNKPHTRKAKQEKALNLQVERLKKEAGYEHE